MGKFRNRAVLAFTALALSACGPSERNKTASVEAAASAASAASAPNIEPQVIPYSSKPEVHGKPRAYEQQALALYAGQVADVVGELKTPYQPAKSAGACFGEVQQNTPVYLAMMIASLFNHMVDARMPGYEGLKKLEPAPSDADVEKLGKRLDQRTAECMKLIPKTETGFDATSMEYNEKARRLRHLGFLALQQMGYAMQDRNHAIVSAPVITGMPDKKFCRAVFRASETWQDLRRRTVDEIDRDNFEVYLEKFSSGMYRLCPDPSY